jgi:hypothetical protein
MRLLRNDMQLMPAHKNALCPDFSPEEAQREDHRERYPDGGD